MDNNYNNDSYNYNPYSNPQSGFSNADAKQEEQAQSAGQNMYQAYDAAYKKETKKPNGWMAAISKTIAVALVFGLVAGTAGLSVVYFGGNALGIFADAEKEQEDNKETESEETEDDRTVEGGLPQTDTESLSNVSVMDVSDIVNSAMPSVVAISNMAEITYQNWWGQVYTDESESAGTGFLVEQDEKYIYIATNNHVVEGATTLTVQFSDGSTAEAQVKGTVASKDLAVITVALEDISAETLSVIRLAALGDSNELEVGEAAIAIGNALGYGQSVTTGVISALGRSVTVQDSTTGNAIINNNLIQTDAAINPGNSGGALLNIKGEVIGINSVKYSDTAVEGIGYAIPITDAMLIIDKLIDGQKIEEAKSGYLGIQGQDSGMGVYIYKVFAGSAAEKAGLHAGDIITEMEGATISTMSQLKELLSYYPAGEKVTFKILRPNGNEYVEREITVELGDASTLPQE
mgnify:CR=1 FL=1